MSIVRVIAIILIYLTACGGWMILGTATAVRSTGAFINLGGQVEEVWGRALIQNAPAFTHTGTGAGEALVPTASTVAVDLRVEHRRKGLVWYPTYLCAFDGSYAIVNPDAEARTVRVAFAFPNPHGTYEDFAINVDGAPLVATIDTAHGVQHDLRLEPGQRRLFHVHYRTRGLAQWTYLPAGEAGRVQNLDLVVTTTFAAVDFPAGSMSPMTNETIDGDGRRLAWKTADLITRQQIAVSVPERLNPGPVASRITFFAPVCLLFFFVLIATLNVVRGVGIHPMHYLFTAAGFFAFHLLLAYLVDVLDIHLAFAIAATASVVLVTTYLRAALGSRFPWLAASAAQGFFLVLFSYSFFLRGATGLTVAIGSVVTLAVLMRVTAGIDWNRVFATPAKVGPGRAPSFKA